MSPGKSPQLRDRDQSYGGILHQSMMKPTITDKAVAQQYKMCNAEFLEDKIKWFELNCTVT
jgi:hypothetical protein